MQVIGRTHDCAVVAECLYHRIVVRHDTLESYHVAIVHPVCRPRIAAIGVKLVDNMMIQLLNGIKRRLFTDVTHISLIAGFQEHISTISRMVALL